MAISTLCLSPEDRAPTARSLRWATPNFSRASMTISSSSSGSHQTFLRYGYLPSMTVSNTVSPKLPLSSAGTLATFLAISPGVLPSTDSPSMSTSPDVGSCILLMHFIIVVLPQPFGPIRPTSCPGPSL